jgi:hypothetical protein
LPAPSLSLLRFWTHCPDDEIHVMSSRADRIEETDGDVWDDVKPAGLEGIERR